MQYRVQFISSLVTKPEFIRIVLTGLCVLLSAFAYSASEIIINKPLSEHDSRYEYPRYLLDKVLEKTETVYGKARILESRLNMKRDRALLELEKGVDLHVMAEASKPAWEQRLLVVKIPIRKGIQGFRTFLILKKNQKLLSQVKELEQLKVLATGSGEQWSTTRVLRENGFNVVTGTSYEGLFDMLVRGRFVTFGRGINEAGIEYTARQQKFPELAIEQDLLLYIPLPTYFFVSPTRPQLAKRIRQGLEALIASGEFDAMFMAEFGELIKSARLSERRIFRIANPNLSDDAALDVDAYWYQP